MNIKRIVALILAVVLACGMLASCSPRENDTPKEGFDYSAAFDSEGFFKDVKASEHITLPDYSAFEMPEDMKVASKESVDKELAAIKNSFKKKEKDTDTQRVLANGDTVNIDYIGTIDGVEFEGNSTEGKGTDVTIGVTNYIEGFLEQLVGHKAGEQFDINVKFPEDYGKEELNGKDAVFNITINHIYKDVYPEINEEFVKENLSTSYSSLDAFMKDLESRIVDQQQRDFVWNKLIEESEVKDYPQRMMDYEKEYYKNSITQQAQRYGMEVDEFVGLIGAESLDAYIADIEEELKEVVKSYLVVQAISEKENIKVQNNDISRYFEKYMGNSDYSGYERAYGKPYVKFVVMNEIMLNNLISAMNA